MISVVFENAAAQSLSHLERTRIEQYGEQYVRALNSSHADTSAKTINAIFAASTLEKIGLVRIQKQMERIKLDFGALEYHNSEIAEFNMGNAISLVLHVYAKPSGAAMWRDFQFRIEANPPHKFTELAFIAEVAEPVYLPNGAITDPNTLSWLNNYIDKLIRENDLSGTVLIAEGERLVFERAFGFADAKRAVQVTSETRFNLGSGNKMFTALAIAQLVAAGKLNYSDPLIKFFPHFPKREFAGKATIHHLLSHTSGVGEFWTDEYKKHWHEIKTLQDYLPWIYKAGVNFEPGKEFHYSNSNFLLAGLIIEQASGMDYYDYIRKNIYQPLGMTASDSYFRNDSKAGLAAPLKRVGESWVVADQNLRGSSAGGGYSTTRDMLKFARGLVAGKILSKENLSAMLASKTRGLAEASDYGYGFILSSESNVPSYGHGGIAAGVNFEFRYFPQRDLMFVIFCNQNNGAYDDLRKNIIKLITGAR
jgi:CubicO group peptidase (beta-lactamase class C family)